MEPNALAPAHDIPSIVLIVDDDRDTREMYSTYFESSGVWAATAPGPDEAFAAVEELKPDAIVTDIGFGGQPSGVPFVHRLKEDERTRTTPVIVLSGRGTEQVPAVTRQEADMFLVKPVLPDRLLDRVRDLIARSRQQNAAARQVRDHSRRTAERAHSLVEHSQRLMAASRSLQDDMPMNRACPSCGRPLEWLERASVGGTEYDYYRWCLRGCGLYCFDQHAHTWIKLA